MAGDGAACKMINARGHKGHEQLESEEMIWLLTDGAVFPNVSCDALTGVRGPQTVSG